MLRKWWLYKLAALGLPRQSYFPAETHCSWAKAFAPWDPERGNTWMAIYATSRTSEIELTEHSDTQCQSFLYLWMSVAMQVDQAANHATKFKYTIWRLSDKRRSIIATTKVTGCHGHG